MTIIYCYDVYCSWCFGFYPIIKKLSRNFSRHFGFEVLSGGMILPENPVHISITASHILSTYKKVESLTGVTFGNDYLWHIKNPLESDWYPNSEKAAIALSIFKEYFPEKQIDFATDLELALMGEGRDLCDDEAYRQLLLQYNIPETDFYESLHSRLFRDKAYEEFALVKQLKVTGFPCLFLQESESKLHMLANGYTDYNSIVVRINTIIKEQNL